MNQQAEDLLMGAPDSVGNEQSARSAYPSKSAKNGKKRGELRGC